MSDTTGSASESVDQALSIVSIAAESYRYLWRQAMRLALPVSILILLHFAWTLYLDFVAPSGTGTIATGIFGMVDPIALVSRHRPPLRTLLPNLVVVFFGLAFLVALHRQVILGERQSGIAFFRWRPFVVSYAWTGFLLVLIYSIVSLVTLLPVIFALYGIGIPLLGIFPNLSSGWRSVTISLYNGTLELIPALFIMRYLLALPAAAVGEPHPIRRSKAAAATHWHEMFGLFFLIMAPFWLVRLFVQIAWALYIDGHQGNVAAVASAWIGPNELFWAITDSVEITLVAITLSTLYLHVMGGNALATFAPPPPSPGA